MAELLRRRPVLAPGQVWLAGAGPGDPGCLTLDVLAGLTQANALVHDALVSEQVLALAAPGTAMVFAGKRRGKASAQQEEINATLIALARAGRRVLRLKGGDPFVFGRGGEEALALAEAGVPFRVLPGVTAGLAGLAVAGIPVTMRQTNQAVILATGHSAAEAADLDWATLARTGQPIILYMALYRLPQITAALMAGGLPRETPSAIVSAATMPEQRVLISTLGEVADVARRESVAAPAIVAIGAIVALRERLCSLAATVVSP